MSFSIWSSRFDSIQPGYWAGDTGYNLMSNGRGGTLGLAWSASLSNGTYGSSSTVTPLSLSYLPIIKY